MAGGDELTLSRLIPLAERELRIAEGCIGGEHDGHSLRQEPVNEAYLRLIDTRLASDQGGDGAGVVAGE